MLNFAKRPQLIRTMICQIVALIFKRLSQNLSDKLHRVPELARIDQSNWINGYF